jgi:hypothetical protein
MNIAVLWEEDFPSIDTCATTQERLRAVASTGDTVRFVGLAELSAALVDSATVLITPYGSAFPKAAWTVLFDFLKRGGSWVNLGGAPLSRPVRRHADGRWHVEVPQTAYSKALFINQAFPIDLEGSERWEWTGALARQDPSPPLPECARAWSLQVRFTDTKDFPREQGSSGTRDAALQTQLYALRQDRRVAAPIVIVDRLRGPFAGGRWVLVNAELTAPLDPALLRALCRQAVQGPIELEVHASFACYYPGECPGAVIRVKAHRQRGDARLKIVVTHADVEVASRESALALTGMPTFLRVEWPDAETASPGLYTVQAHLSPANGEGVVEAVGGFWRYDEPLLHSGRPLTLNRDYFERDGQPYPVMGTTYMAGDTHRKFLFEPNPAVWDRDFAAMKAAGVNMVRTGLWTAWKRAMLDPGAVDEGVLRAFTAFLLTARTYDIPVIFNFFAFTPEEWGGGNPYLDPRAVEAQRELVAAFAQRFAGVDDLIWDFINEPSFSSPARTWSTRPNYDAFERAAWAAWLQERASAFSADEADADPDDVWRERWRLTPNTPLDLPALADFQDQHIFQGTHPLRVLDYRLFAQERFNRWVSALAQAVRSNGNPHQLITVGQDEGGTGDRPNPHFFAEVVDFTTNHSWWQNDDLLWDSVMTKTPNKPNLIQETGIMFVENVDGGYRRSPEACAGLLKHKLALAFAAGCAGAIQWLWNTNVTMDSDNEVGIGFLRADGTEKPELDAFRGLAQIFWENRRLMVGRQLEEIAIVVPYSNLFSVRNTADAATRRAIRVLEYDLGLPTRTVSEYHLQEIGDPKLLLLPSPRVLTQECWEALLAKVEAGATLLATGFLEADAYGRPVPRLTPFGLKTRPQPVLREERIVPEGAGTTVYGTFEGDKLHKLERAQGVEAPLTSLYAWRHGRGLILYCPLPMELSSSAYQTLHLYKAALQLAAFDTSQSSHLLGLLVRRVEFAHATLYLLVSESSSEAASPEKIPFGLRVAPGDAAVAFVERESGKMGTLTSVPTSLG